MTKVSNRDCNVSRKHKRLLQTIELKTLIYYITSRVNMQKPNLSADGEVLEASLVLCYQPFHPAFYHIDNGLLDAFPMYRLTFKLEFAIFVCIGELSREFFKKSEDWRNAYIKWNGCKDYLDNNEVVIQIISTHKVIFWSFHKLCSCFLIAQLFNPD